MYWGKADSAPSTFRGVIKVQDIKEIREAKRILCAVKKIMTKDYSKRMDKTFAIVTSSTVLELEAPTIDSKKLWMGYFKILVS